ncbi:MAG: hypothetical protein EOR11_20105 [Mesorhizobium sp.]|uniref:hypothetical protein n=1 Tax=Mesorhizobium sp. TaxID=1871066 RepID=UPI000FE572F0|nr:hypothetical protein [Mesorhizobium sp.]RWP84766.1 MAG: hypothetical protein EOR11_20105 [Mesorhizobium sp.]
MAKQSAAAPKARAFSFAPVALAALPDIPTAVKRAPNENDLPFRKEFFSKVPDVVQEPGQSATLFVPKAFWETRDVDMSKVDGAYQKGKLRDQFNKWRDETKVITQARERGEAEWKDGKLVKQGKVLKEEVSTNEARGKYVFFAVERTGKEPEKIWTDMGLDPKKDAEEGVQVIVYIPK